MRELELILDVSEVKLSDRLMDSVLGLRSGVPGSVPSLFFIVCFGLHHLLTAFCFTLVSFASSVK